MARACACVLAAATLVGCSWAPEEPILDQFFSASRLADRTSLANLTTVTFAPNQQGIVIAYDITTVTPEQRSPFGTSEKTVVDLSINGGPTHIDVSKYDGDLLSKDVSISAAVKLPTGQTQRKNLIVTMQRAVLKADKEIVGNWIITGIRDAAGAASTPRS